MDRQDDFRNRPQYYPALERLVPWKIAAWMYCLQLLVMGVLAAYVVLQIYLGEHERVGGRGMLALLALTFCFVTGPAIMGAVRFAKSRQIFPEYYRNRWPILLRSLSVIGVVGATVIAFGALETASKWGTPVNLASMQVVLIAFMVSYCSAGLQEVFILLAEG